MADVDLQRVAFPDTRRHSKSPRSPGSAHGGCCATGSTCFKAGDREYKFFVVERGAVEIVEHSSGETKRVDVA